MAITRNNSNRSAFDGCEAAYAERGLHAELTEAESAELTERERAEEREATASLFLEDGRDETGSRRTTRRSSSAGWGRMWKRRCPAAPMTTTRENMPTLLLAGLLLTSLTTVFAQVMLVTASGGASSTDVLQRFDAFLGENVISELAKLSKALNRLRYAMRGAAIRVKNACSLSITLFCRNAVNATSAPPAEIVSRILFPDSPRPCRCSLCLPDVWFPSPFAHADPGGEADAPAKQPPDSMPAGNASSVSLPSPNSNSNNNNASAGKTRVVV